MRTILVLLTLFCASCTAKRQIISTTTIPYITPPEENTQPVELDTSTDDDDTPDITGEEVDMTVPLETEVTKDLEGNFGPRPIQKVWLDKPSMPKYHDTYNPPAMDVDKGLL